MKNDRRFRYRLKDFDLEDPESKRRYNAALFSPVSSVYSKITRVLSFGRDGEWKKKLLESVPLKEGAEVLDIACGPGDLSFLAAQRMPGAEITGIDLNTDMLRLARGNLDDRYPGLRERIRFVSGDMNNLDFGDESFDLVTGGYALRNSPSLEKSLHEIFRVLRPGGYAAFLDFSKSHRPFARKIQLGLLSFWGRLWGLVFHRNPEVYGYIAESLKNFPHAAAFRELLQSSGFDIIEDKPVLLGLLHITAVKKPDRRE